MNAQETTGNQIFAADGRLRGRAMQLALVTGGLLLVAWMTALGFGAFGGFGSLPRPGFAQAEHHATSTIDNPPIPVRTATPQKAKAAPTPAPVRAVRSPVAQSNNGKAEKRPVSSVSPAPTVPATNALSHGNSAKTTTGKPLDTPGGPATGITHGLGHQK
jgi:hypothetical protein